MSLGIANCFTKAARTMPMAIGIGKQESSCLKLGSDQIVERQDALRYDFFPFSAMFFPAFAFCLTRASMAVINSNEPTGLGRCS